MKDLNNLIGLYLEMDGIVNFYWQIFITASTAVLGWLIVKTNPTNWRRRIIGTLAYTFFALVILEAIDANSKLFEAVAWDLRQAAKATNADFVDQSRLQNFFLESEKKTWREFWLWIYLSSWITVSALILFDLMGFKAKKT